MAKSDVRVCGMHAGHATEDTFVHMKHSELLRCAYGGDSNLITFRGDHNSMRPSFFYTSVRCFFHNVLQCSDASADVCHTAGCPPPPSPPAPPTPTPCARSPFECRCNPYQRSIHCK